MATESTGQQYKSRWVVRLILALGTSLIVILFTQEEILKLGILRRLELATIDYRFQYRGARPRPADSTEVVIVEITEDSYRSLPAKYPWPRSYYAHLVRNLHRAGARVIALDIIFAGKDIYDPTNDEDLWQAIHETGIVVLAGKVSPLGDSYMHVSSLENYGNEFFHVDSSIGIVNIRNDADGVHRRYSPFFISPAGYPVPTFAIAVLNKYFRFVPFETPQNADDHFIYAGRDMPKFDAGSFLINYAGPSGTGRMIKFVDVIDDESLTTLEERDYGVELNTFSDSISGYLYDGTFRNKIVLVGSRAPEEHDLFPVSIAAGRHDGDNLMYGVEIHANVIENILQRQFLQRQSPLWEIVLVILFTLLTFFTTSALKSSQSRFHSLVELNTFLFALVEIFVISLVALLSFEHFNYLVAVIGPILAVMGGYFASTTYHFILERKQRIMIKQMFSTYLNPAVVDELIRHPEKLRLGGERRELTVLFADIEGFTSIAEGMQSEELVHLLNEYLSTMSDAILRHLGTLDKYHGDSVMAFWGAPESLPDHAKHACLAALEMQEQALRIREAWQRQQRPALHLRIGVNTGEMVVGNMGAMRKFDYTVIGDSVNLGSRLEGANKQYGTRIIISEYTHRRVDGAFITRELDLITVKGRNEPVRIFELVQPVRLALQPALHDMFAAYERGICAYRERCWDDAHRAFMTALTLIPDDRPTAVYLRRIEVLRKNPPSAEWNGVYEMTAK